MHGARGRILSARRRRVDQDVTAKTISIPTRTSRARGQKVPRGGAAEETTTVPPRSEQERTNLVELEVEERTSVFDGRLRPFDRPSTSDVAFPAASQ